MYEKTQGGTYVNKKQLVLTGKFGYDHIQDDLLLYSVVQQLKKEGIEPIVLSGNPEKTSKQYEVKAIHRLDFSSLLEVIKQTNGLLLLEGNALHRDASLKNFLYFLSIMKLAQMYNKSTFFYSQKLEKTKHSLFFPFFKQVMKKCTHRFASINELSDLPFSFQKEKDLMFELVSTKQLLLPVSLETFLQQKPVLFLTEETKIEEMNDKIQHSLEKNIPVLLFPSSFSTSSSSFKTIAAKWGKNDLFYAQKEELTLEEIAFVLSFVSTESQNQGTKNSLISTITDVFEVKKNE